METNDWGGFTTQLSARGANSQKHISSHIICDVSFSLWSRGAILFLKRWRISCLLVSLHCMTSWHLPLCTFTKSWLIQHWFQIWCFSVFYTIFLSVFVVCFNLVRGRRRDSMIGCPLKPPSWTASETRQCRWTLTIAQDDLDCREADCRRTAGGCRRELWAMSRGRSVRKYNLLSRFLLAAGFAAFSLVEHRHRTLRNQL